jgi:hypothetical protein
MLSLVGQRWPWRWEGENYPAFVVQGRYIEASRSWCGVHVDGKKKSDEETKKKLEMDRRKKDFLVARSSGVGNLKGALWTILHFSFPSSSFSFKSILNRHVCHLRLTHHSSLFYTNLLFGHLYDMPGKRLGFNFEQRYIWCNARELTAFVYRWMNTFTTGSKKTVAWKCDAWVVTSWCLLYRRTLLYYPDDKL